MCNGHVFPEVDTKKLCATEPRFVAAKDVQEGDFLVYPKPKPEPASTVLPLEFARLAGYYLAEGHAALTNGCESLVFSFHIDEADYVDEVRRATKDLYDAEGSVRFDESKHEARILIYSKPAYAAVTVIERALARYQKERDGLLSKSSKHSR